MFNNSSKVDDTKKLTLCWKTEFLWMSVLSNAIWKLLSLSLLPDTHYQCLPPYDCLFVSVLLLTSILRNICINVIILIAYEHKATGLQTNRRCKCRSVCVTVPENDTAFWVCKKLLLLQQSPQSFSHEDLALIRVTQPTENWDGRWWVIVGFKSLLHVCRLYLQYSYSKHSTEIMYASIALQSLSLSSLMSPSSL